MCGKDGKFLVCLFWLSKSIAVGDRRNMSRSFVSELSQRFLSRDERFSRRENAEGHDGYCSRANAQLQLPLQNLCKRRKAHNHNRRRFFGIGCRIELSCVGYDVTVLEARDRLGGRVHTLYDFIRDKTVEAGAELIGANHPTWQAYAKRFKLEMLERTDYPDSAKPCFFSGKLLSPKEAETLWHEVDEQLNLYNALALKIDPIQPWRSPNALTLDNKTVDNWIDDLKCSELCKRAIRLSESSDANDPGWESLLGRLCIIKGGGLEKYWTDTEVYRCKGGNQQLAEKLADAIGRQRIRLGNACYRWGCAEQCVKVELSQRRNSRS